MGKFKALKEIDELIYYDLVQNGARTLFDYMGFHVIDGVKEDEESYFLWDEETERIYLIDLETCYLLVTTFYYVNDKYYLEEILGSIVLSVSSK